jgi:hypothetical protein
VVSLKPVADQLAFLAEDGFRRKSGFLLRQDRLLRGVGVSPCQDTGAEVSFFLTFDLGIPGISEVGARSSEYVVRLAGDTFARAESGYVGSFEFKRELGNEKILAVVAQTAEAVCEEFLLKYPDEQSLFEMVYRGATEFLSRGMAATDEMTRLRLVPWNVMARFLLAGVYVAFLGKQTEAEEVVRLATAYATGRKASLDYLLPNLIANVESAAAAHSGAEP